VLLAARSRHTQLNFNHNLPTCNQLFTGPFSINLKHFYQYLFKSFFQRKTDSHRQLSKHYPLHIATEVNMIWWRTSVSTSKVKSRCCEFRRRSISRRNLLSLTAKPPSSLMTEPGSAPTSSQNTRPNRSVVSLQRPSSVSGSTRLPNTLVALSHQHTQRTAQFSQQRHWWHPKIN